MSELQASGGCEIGNLAFSNFQFLYGGGLLTQIGFYPGTDIPLYGPPPTASDILITATPFSVTFSTDFGADGGFTNCRGCIEDEGSFSYDVSTIRPITSIVGMGLLLDPSSLPTNGSVTQIGCLGPNNPESEPGYQLTCSNDPSSEAKLAVCGGAFFLQGGTFSCSSGQSADLAQFSPVSAVSNGFRLFVNAYPQANVPSFTNLILQVDEPGSFSILFGGLLGLWALSRKNDLHALLKTRESGV
jgi:hypothetical protein